MSQLFPASRAILITPSADRDCAVTKELGTKMTAAGRPDGAGISFHDPCTTG